MVPETSSMPINTEGKNCLPPGQLCHNNAAVVGGKVAPQLKSLYQGLKIAKNLP